MMTFLAGPEAPANLSRLTNSQEGRPGYRHRFLYLLLVILAVVGVCISGYLAVYQIGLLDKVWEPFFGDGSDRVLHSFISRLLPIPDALLGMAAYAIEAVAAALMTIERYRRSSAVLLCYGGIAIGLATVGILLAALQVFVLHAMCTLCLCSVVLSVIIAWLARDEIMLAWQIVREERL